MTVKQPIAVVLAVAAAGYWYYTSRPRCHMCQDTGLIKCRTCYGKGIHTITSVRVDPDRRPSTGRLGGRLPRGFCAGPRRTRMERLDEPIKEICPVCKGTKLSPCLACRTRVTYKLSKAGEPTERTVCARDGTHIRTDKIDSSTGAKLD